MNQIQIDYLTAIIEPVAEHRTERVIRWLKQYQWMVAGVDGKMMDLERLDFEHLDDGARLDLANHICNELRTEIEEHHRQLQAEGRGAVGTVADAAKPDRPQVDQNLPQTVLPKPRQDTAEAQRREVDDEALAGLALKFLRQNRTAEFTYNQVKDALGVADWQQAKRVLEALAKRGNDIVLIKGKSKEGKKLEVFKFAPHRKMLDRDYSRADEIVAEAIMEYLSEEPHQSGTAIRDAMQQWFGHVNDHLVRAALHALVADGKITAVPGPRRSTLHSVCLSV